MEIIKQKEPESKKSQLIFTAIFLSTLLLLGLIFGGWSTLKILFPIALIIITIFEIVKCYERTYDGWLLDSNGISLLRVDLLRGRQSYLLRFDEITSIKYIQPQPRIPLTFVFYTNQGKRVLTPKIEIFKFAPLLKFLFEKGIIINYSVSDHEVDLYIKGKIDSLPMTNDMKIKYIQISI